MSSKKHFLSLKNLENEIQKDLLANSIDYLQQRHFHCLQIYENRSKTQKNINIQSFKLFFNQDDSEDESLENKIKVLIIIRLVNRICVDNEDAQEQDYNIKFLCSVDKNSLCMHVVSGILILKQLLKLENPNMDNLLLDAEDNQKQQTKIQKQKQQIVDALSCQICLEPLKNPVLLPCNNHFLCLNCAKTFLKQQKQVKGIFLLMCPTCGESEQTVLYRNVNELKVFHAFLNFDQEYNELILQMDNQIKNQQLYIESLASHLSQLLKSGNSKQYETPTNLKKQIKLSLKNLEKTVKSKKKTNFICIDSDDNEEEENLSHCKESGASPDFFINIDTNEQTEMAELNENIENIQQ